MNVVLGLAVAVGVILLLGSLVWTLKGPSAPTAAAPRDPGRQKTVSRAYLDIIREDADDLAAEQHQRAETRRLAAASRLLYYGTGNAAKAPPDPKAPGPSAPQ